jgi:flagellar biosynthetic protein FliR
VSIDARWLLAAARLAPVAFLAPPLGRSITVRVGVAALWVALVAPLLPAGASPSVWWRELLVGVALGVTAAVPFAAAHAAGALVDRARDPGGRGPLGTMYSLLALALFAALDGPRLLVVAVAQSYAALPVGDALAPGAAVALEAGARLIGTGLLLAAPALAALALVELLLGLVARAEPAVADAVEASSLRTLATAILLSLGAVALAGALLGDGGLRSLTATLTDAAKALSR